ncbi:MAG: dockerin type I domain-containing protein [Pirellulaceae bacterium]|nr:dockerin type I domain-containing protein [Pirellulaceae bacterium]
MGERLRKGLVPIEDNILYRFDAGTGAADNRPYPEPRPTDVPPDGAGTNIYERGQIVTTGAAITTVAATNAANPWSPTVSIQDGTRFEVSGETFEFDTGPEVSVNIDTTTGQVIRDGHFMILDGDFFQFDTGSTFIVPTGGGAVIPDALSFTFYATTGAVVRFEFDDDGSFTPGSQRISYDATMTRDQLRTAIINRINTFITGGATAVGADLISLRGETRVDLGGNLQVDTTNTVLSTLTQTPATRVRQETILIPASGWADGQTFTISDGNATVLFEFEDTDNPNGLVNPGAYQIGFGAGTTAQDVATQIIAGLQARDVRVLAELATNAPRSGVLGLRLHTALELSGELGDAPILSVLGGTRFNDAETFVVRTVDGTVTFEVDLGDGVAAGNVLFPVDAADSAVLIAERMASYINDFTLSEATAVYESLVDGVAYVALNAQQIPLGRTTPVAHLLATETSSALDIVALFDYLPAPTTFAAVDGLLNGFEETMTTGQFQTRLAAELNIRREITGATNDAGAPIVITSNDHALQTGQSVIIRDIIGDLVQGIAGQVFANGLFTVTVVDGNTFALDGTEFRNFSGAGQFNYDDGGYFIAYEANSSGERTNFLGGNEGRFVGVPIFTDRGTQGGVAAGNVRVPLRAQDTAGEVGAVMRQLIHRELYPTVTVTRFGSTLLVNNGVVGFVDPPLRFSSRGTGGRITGIAFLDGNSVMYAVDDRGGLYRVSLDPTWGFVNSTTFVANIGGIEWAGLSAGPQQLEGGLYSDLLFGISRTGSLYAFNTSGVLQPIFVNGWTSVQTGATGQVTGLAFSNLDKNLWHVTDNRDTDAGHGTQASVDASRDPTQGRDGNTSFYFGFQNPDANAWGRLDPTNRNNYNFPGGAHGSLESNTFSLTGYSASDDPVLYFNYFLGTEGTNYDPNNPMRDAFRVFISADNGQWQLLATNDSGRSNAWIDEYQLGEGAVPQADQEFGRRGIQELYDNTGTWRQARIQLAPWAGMDNLKIRFDFSTAASMGVGSTGGVDIRGVAGTKIRDGEMMVVDANFYVRFEFDFGHVLVTPAGRQIVDGTQLNIEGVIYEFDSGDGISGDVPLMFSVTDTAENIAETIQGRLHDPVNFPVYRDGNRLNLPWATVVDVLDSELIHEGTPGVSGTNLPLLVDLSMTPEQVATVVRQALEDHFAGGDFGPGGDGYQNIKMFREVVRLVGHAVIDPGPLGLNSTLQGDSFGAFNASGPPDPNNHPGSLRGMANNFEGVYIDDIIIGLAERGELVTGATGNGNFVASPLVPDNAQLRGMYQVHVRRGPEYGEPDNTLPVTFNILRSFDTNDRLSHEVSLVAPSADQLHDGQTFQISDGVRTVVFEFEDMNVGNGVTPGNLMIPFNAQLPDTGGGFTPEPDYVIARRIRDAINSLDAQAVIKVVAALADGEVTTPADPPRPGFLMPLYPVPSTNNVINLFGNATGDVFPTFYFGAIDVIAYGYREETMVGDNNLFRDQGQMLIHSNTIRDALQFGIVADAGQRTRSDLVPNAGTLPHVGPPANMRVRNAERLAPGAVIMNNVIANSRGGGIRFSGDPATTGELGTVPFGRIVNNSIHGNGTGVGIQVTENASPTILNNILSNVQTGVSIDATSSTTQLGGLLFQNVATPSSSGVLGAFPIVLQPTDPLFVDPANYNFLLAAGSKAIDSSIDSLEDRQNLFFVKDPLGISKSPILAPERDVFGQLRADDPSVNTPEGQGQNVFKDRGAVDRVDFIGPFALLLNPRDNDAEGIDANPRDTIVNITATLTNFSIQLVDRASGGGEGTGPDDTSVVPAAVTLVRDGRTMVRGVDYSFAYDATSNTIRLSPIAGIWEKDRTYEIDLANSVRAVASFLTTTPADGTLLTIVDRSSPAKTAKFEYETGFILLVPANGGAALVDGETFTLAQGSVSKVFELDSNNTVASGNVRVAFTATSTQNDIANAIVAAITSSGLPLTPRNVGQGRVHIGGNANTTLNTTATTLTQTGTPGTADPEAVAIAIIPGRGEQVAQLSAAAINLAVTQGKLVGVKAEAYGSDLIITGAASVTGVGVTSVSPIRDLAGNLLRPNRADSTTRFTIITGLGIDFGDAPAPYATLREDNGAGHRILPGFYLGQFVDAESNGQPSAMADADLSDDGVTIPASLVSSQVATIQVVASAAGRLDAWLDANGDGDWTDAGEKIFDNRALVAGNNSLTFTVNATAVGVPTFLRFRLSSTGGLSPTGIVDDGEVEDYAVTIQANPFQNPARRRDVNADKSVSAIDALLIINMINRHPDWQAPTRLADTGLVSPPYVDVNGDGFLSAQDALLVINVLNGGPENEPEGEGEADGWSLFDRQAAILSDVLEDLVDANDDLSAAAARDDYFARWGG